MFIVFEGIDGSGKTTQIKLLSKFLQNSNIKHIVTKEPGGTYVGDQIRSILLSKSENNILPITEAYLFAASRAQHIELVIKPALSKGDCVICDRFLDSSLAYQSGARGLSDTLIKKINEPALQNIKPDIVFLLDIPPKKAYLYGPKDRIEKQGILFQEKVREKYLELAKNNKNYIVIDATLPKKQIHNIITESISI